MESLVNVKRPLSVSARRKISERSKKENFSLKLIGSLNVAWTHTHTLSANIKTNIFLSFFSPSFFLFHRKVEACVDVSEWYYRMFQKNLKLRTNIVVGTVPLQNYETPQKTTDVAEDFSLHPQCATATEEHEDDTQPLKNSERAERGRSSLSRTYPTLLYIYMYIYICT